MKKTLFSFGIISIALSPFIVVSCKDDSNNNNDSDDISAVMNELKIAFGDKQTSKSTAQTLRSDLQRKNSGNEADFLATTKIENFSFPPSRNGTQIRWAYEGKEESGYNNNGSRFTIKFTVSKPGSYVTNLQWPSFVNSKDYLSDSPEDQLTAIYENLNKDNFVASGNQTKTSATNMVNHFVPTRDFVTQLNYFGLQLDASNENFNYVLNGENIRANESLRRVEGLSITITHKEKPTITKTTSEFSISGYATLNEENCYIVMDDLDNLLIFGSDITSTKNGHDLELVVAGTSPTNPIAHGEGGTTVSTALGLPTEIAERIAVINLRGTTVTYYHVSHIAGSQGMHFIFKAKISISGTEKEFNFVINSSDYIPL